MWIKILPQNKMNEGEGITLISSERPYGPLFLLRILAACYILSCPYLLHFFLYPFFLCVSNKSQNSCTHCSFDLMRHFGQNYNEKHIKSK
jgi:hypothetical protein